MHSSVDPTVSLFISQIRKIKEANRAAAIMLELKKLSNTVSDDEHSEVHNLWKKLYLLNIGVRINYMDFIKASANQNYEIKALGYLGISLCEIGEEMILLQHVFATDITKSTHRNTVLRVLANVCDETKKNHDLVMTMQAPKEGTPEYLKYLILRSRYDGTLFFSIVSTNEPTLYVKIQIILDNDLVNKLDLGAVKWILNKISTFKSPFLKHKAFDLLYKLCMISKLCADDELIQYLKTFVVQKKINPKKDIEIALAINAMRLLIAFNSVNEKLEEFVFKLITSSETNLQFMGFKHAQLFQILPEIAIGVIFRTGIDQKIHFDALIRHIGKSNFRNVYRRLNELRQITASGNAQIHRREILIQQIILKLCEFGDQEFVCRAVYENPVIYPAMRHKGLISREQCKEFFRMLIQSTIPSHFLVVYDLFPLRSKSNEHIAELGAKHAAILLVSEGDDREYIWSNMIDFLCTHGDPKLNRKSVINSVYKEKGRHFDRFMKYIELFNISVDERMLYMGNGQFMKYCISSGTISVIQPNNLEYLRVTANSELSYKESSDKNGQIIRTYSASVPLNVQIEFCFDDKMITRSVYIPKNV